MKLIAERVSKYVGSTLVFANLSLEVREGDIVSVVGPSGSGKTTLLHILASYDKPSTGTLTFNGLELTNCDDKALAAYRSKVGFVHQEPLLFGELSAMDNILLPLIAGPKDVMKDRRQEAVSLATKLGVGLILDRKAAVLSTGEKKRVEVVRALLRSPSVIMADEPTANLDEESSSFVIDTLREAVETSGAALLVSVHQDQRLLDIAKRRIELADYK
jgi:ABC-type lipoprotein export system ATPase subunit